MGTAKIVRVDDQAASGFRGCHSWARPRPSRGPDVGLPDAENRD
jgi:hypothetical protein